MFLDNLNLSGINTSNPENPLTKLNYPGLDDIYIYPNSINELNETVFFIGKSNSDKYLFVIYEAAGKTLAENFSGEIIHENDFIAKRCPLSNENAGIIQENFSFTKPVLLGLNNSFGFGDRLGLANAGHIRSLGKSEFKPILAQQSIRELTRTKRKPEDVMAASVWAVFQEGYKSGFGSDADHLKTTDDIDLMINNGFTMFTFDPGDHVNNDADDLSLEQLSELAQKISWEKLDDSLEKMLARYENNAVDLKDGFIISPTKENIIRGAVKYCAAIAHIYAMSNHLVNNYGHLPFEIEVSVDETESVTTPFEHFFIASELNRLSVKIVSLAPRFIGDFEKGIDYKGDIDLFKEEYLKHVKITEHFGSYKISLHSGSDKFDVYAAIGSLKRGFTHVKTAGTSYLEAIKVIAAKEKELFREILNFSRVEYEKEKNSYHVSADIKNVKPASDYSDEELLKLFIQNDARQVLHVTFGKVLTTQLEDSSYLFRDKILNCLKREEQTHYNYLISHFRRHLSPFETAQKDI